MSLRYPPGSLAKLRLTPIAALTLALLIAASPGNAGPKPPPPLVLLPATFWAPGIASSPRIPMAGDADGDGRDDILVFYPEGDGIIDFARTSPLGKPCFPDQARTRFGRDGLTAVCGRFTGPSKMVSVLAVFDDGLVRVASEMQDRKFQRDDLVAAIPATMAPNPPLQAAVGDFDGDGNPDVLLAGRDGRLLLLHNERTADGIPRFTPLAVAGELPKLANFTAGDLQGKGRAEVIWIEKDGRVFRAGITLHNGSAQMGRPKEIIAGAPGDKIVAGRFSGARREDLREDLIVGQRLLPDGRRDRAQVEMNLPSTKEAADDFAWLAADLEGDGRDDLVRVRRSSAKFVGDDILVQRWGAPGAADPLASTSSDGLPDAWKTGVIKPGGLDLTALGCSPLHHDVIVEVQPLADVPDKLLHSEMDRAIKYYASLPVKNADGTTGIAMHVIYGDPIPTSESSKSWEELGDLHFPAARRGITHWMVVYNAGGGQSSQMGDRGSCGSHALYATFLHEFGHQVGLDHTGYWGPAWCPIYPSMMNYAYSYQLNGKPDQIGYSDGRLASVVLDERHLSETLPLPMDQVAFLAGPPYHYRLKPTPDGKGTLIDWNWNGVFGEKDVAADINYGYSTTAGLRHTIGKTYTAPAAVSCGTGPDARLMLFVGRLPEGAPRPPANATAQKPGLAPDQPGRLLLRIWKGSDPASDGDDWSDEIPVDPAGVTGDPSACSLGEAAWIAYPTTAGIRLRRVTLDSEGKPLVGEPIAVPDSQGAQPTLVADGSRLDLLIWRDAKTPVGIRFIDSKNGAWSVGSETPMGFTSNAPVGAAAAPDATGVPALWVGLTQDEDAGRPSRWQVRRFLLEPNGSIQQVSQEWIGGEKGGERGNGRVMLLWEANKAYGVNGQLYFFACGAFGKDSPWSCHYVAMRIADTSVNGGWLTRRYYDEWTQSRSAPGVCFYRGDIAFAARWFGDVHGWDNDNLFVAFYGRGIESEPMGDFDDIGLIRDVGLSHSIAYVAP